MKILLLALTLLLSAPAMAEKQYTINTNLNFEGVVQCLGIVTAMAPASPIDLDRVISELYARAASINKKGAKYLVYRWGFQHATAELTSKQVSMLQNRAKQEVLRTVLSALKCYVEK